MSYLPINVLHAGAVVGQVSKALEFNGPLVSITGSSTTQTITIDTSSLANKSGATFTGNLVLNGANIVLTGSETIAGRRVDQDGLVLDAINTGTGVVVRTGTNTYAKRTITGTSNQITLTNGDGVSSNPTISLPSTLVLPGTNGVTIPSGTTAQRPGSPTAATLRFNTDTALTEGWDGSSWLALVNDADLRLYTPNIRSVKAVPGKGQYSTVAAALASITDASSTNRYSIQVAPGVYNEPQLTMIPYVSIIGQGSETTTLLASDPTNHFIIGAAKAQISRMAIGGSTSTNKATIYMATSDGSTNSALLVDSVKFLSSHTLVLASSGYVQVNNGLYGSTEQFTRGFVAQDDGTHNARVQVRNSTSVGMTAPYPDAVFMGDGTKSLIIAGGTFARANSTTNTVSNTGTGIYLRNGASSRFMGVSIVGFSRGIWVENAGAGPLLDSIAINLEYNTNDLVIDHPGATGSFQGTASRATSSVNTSSNISITYTDVTDQGFINVGSMYMGPTHSQLVDVTDLIVRTPTMGLLDGGNLSAGTGLNILISAGSGYVKSSSGTTRFDWPDTTYTLPANSTAYLYINSSGTVTTNATRPDGTTNIVLGRFFTGASSIVTFSENSTRIANFGNNVDAFNRLALGPVFVSGSIVTENATTARSLDVSNGHYFYSTTERFTPSATAITFLTGYHSSGVPTFGSGTVIDNANYDNGTNLTALTAGYYTKHVLYQSGDGTHTSYNLSYGNGNYSTLLAAQNAALPNPIITPDGSPPLAAIIVQQGATNIVQIIDIRPRIGFAAPASSAASIHGNLLGLSNDDHQQYLLASGSRSMTGGLNMNSNTITNATSVNSVVVEAHASRHLPNGADPLTTAVASGLSTSSTNAVGVANSLARSDHSHAITGFVPTSQLASTNTASTVVLRDGSGNFSAGTITAALTGNASTASSTAKLTTARTIATTGDGVMSVSFDGSANVSSALTLATVNANTGTFNNVTVNGKGLVTAASNVAYLTANQTITLSGDVSGAGTTAITTTLANSGVTAGAYRTVTVDAKGRVLSGIAPTNSIGQVFAGAIAQTSGTTQVPYDNTVPQSTEGTQLMSQAITPQSTSSRISLSATMMIDCSAARNVTVTVFRGTTFIGAASHTFVLATNSAALSINLIDSPASASAVTYTIRIGGSAGGTTWYVGRGSGTTLGGTNPAGWTIMEIL